MNIKYLYKLYAYRHLLAIIFYINCNRQLLEICITISWEIIPFKLFAINIHPKKPIGERERKVRFSNFLIIIFSVYLTAFDYYHPTF